MSQVATASAAVPPPKGVRRFVVPVLLAVVLGYGALLRFDAIALQYDPVIRPLWLRHLQETRRPTSTLRPHAVTWKRVALAPHRDGTYTQYTSDPYTYLQYAREMRSFYGAHRREPLFPFVTKVFLRLLAQQDVAVSFASASFSLLAVLATFLLGSYAYSKAVGLGAAAALAVEYDVVTWGTGGWRDDAFTCAVVLSAYALVRCFREPSSRNAVLLGVIGGLACLVRITSISFLLPAFAILLLARAHPWRRRLTTAALALGVSAAITAPFLVNCWLVYGDPLHAINVHADVYRETEGQAPVGESAAHYVSTQALTRPIRTADTLVLGLTRYPFLNKWSGFDKWFNGLGAALSWASVAGLLLFLGAAAGRLLLLVLGASLLPYAATWRLIADWRFTEHAYPLYLVAAGLALFVLARALASPRRAVAEIRGRVAWKPAIVYGCIAIGLALATWFVARRLPLLVTEEALRAGEETTVAVGDRDGAFFTEGWSAVSTGGNVSTRAGVGRFSVVRIPFPEARDYDLTLRLDPYPRPLTTSAASLPAVRLSVNGHPVARLQLEWRQERVGSYNVHVPKSVLRPGISRLEIAAVPPGGTSSHDSFSLWYVRIHPSGS